MRKPFFWKARGAWYVQVKQPNGKFSPQKLHEDEDTAREIWQDKYAKPAAIVNEHSSYTARGVITLHANYLQQRVLEGTLAQKTVDRRMSDLASFYVRRDLDGLLVRDLKRHHATSWLAAQTKWNATTKHYAAKTVKRAFSWAVDEGHIDFNPLAKFSHECGPARQFCIDRSIHDRLMDGASDPKYRRKRVRCFRLILVALRLSGCRPSEVSDMTIERVDWDNQRWIWSEHKTAKKTGKKRVVTCCPCLWTLTRIAAHNRTSGPLLKKSETETWTYSTMRVRFERLKKRIGEPDDCILYSYRHASITESLKAGVDVATVAAMHGTSIQMIERHYSHVIQDNSHLLKAARLAAKHRVKTGT